MGWSGRTTRKSLHQISLTLFLQLFHAFGASQAYCEVVRGKLPQAAGGSATLGPGGETFLKLTLLPWRTHVYSHMSPEYQCNYMPVFAGP